MKYTEIASQFNEAKSNHPWQVLYFAHLTIDGDALECELDIRYMSSRSGKKYPVGFNLMFSGNDKLPYERLFRFTCDDSLDNNLQDALDYIEDLYSELGLGVDDGY